MSGFEVCPNTAANNFSTPQVMNRIHTYPYGNVHTNFGVLLSKHGWDMTVGFGGAEFLSDLDIGACIF